MLWKSVDFPQNLYLCSQNHNSVNMKKEIHPQETSRAKAFQMWMSSPQPMVTLVKTLDVIRLVKVNKRTGIFVIIVLYSLRALVGGWACVVDFRWLQFISSVIPAFIAWCYWPGVKTKYNMNKMIACCGINCKTCEARIATMKNDDKMRVEVAKKWCEMNHTDQITPESINCTGCRVEGVKFYFCSHMCEVHKCVAAKGYETCGECPDKNSCKKVGAIWENCAEAKENLEAMCYREEAIECVKDHVLQIHKQIYAKYEGDFDRIYTEGYNSKSYTGRVIEPGKVYELSYLECSCPKVKCGLRNHPQQCECSRQSILYILSQLEPDSQFDVRIENTILRGSDRCTFRITML